MNFYSLLTNISKNYYNWYFIKLVPIIYQISDTGHTGFPIKDARFSKLKNFPAVPSDNWEGKIIVNINFKYFGNRESFFWETLYLLGVKLALLFLSLQVASLSIICRKLECLVQPAPPASPLGDPFA